MFLDNLDKKYLFDSVLHDDPYNPDKPSAAKHHAGPVSCEFASRNAESQWDPISCVYDSTYRPPDERVQLLVSTE